MMTIAYGAFPAFVPSGSSPQAVSPVPASIRANLRRVQAMSAAWDRAASALRSGDFAACDEALAQFRSISREARFAQQAAGNNHGN